MRLSAAQIGRTARWAARLALASLVQGPEEILIRGLPVWLGQPATTAVRSRSTMYIAGSVPEMNAAKMYQLHEMKLHLIVTRDTVAGGLSFRGDSVYEGRHQIQL